MACNIPLRTEVLIVGCGPVGATLALMLGKRDVSTLVIDKATDICQMPRAIAFDFDALRILQSAGIDDAAFDRVKIPYVRFVSPLFGEFARINTGIEIDTHPAQITFYQPDLERALRARLAESGSITTCFGASFVDLVQDEGGVTAKVRGLDGLDVEVRARYLVAADGASSTVRTKVGLDFKGKSFAEDWLIIDAGNVRTPIDHVEFICDHRRPTPHMTAPGGRQRWEFMLRRGESRQQMEADAKIEELLAPWGGLDAMEIERRAVYRFHARSAVSYRKGRVFLVGDAAHITPPFVGQGLVSGLRDVANLSWKLAYVLKGDAAEHTLDSYDCERRPHAKKMINVARFMGKLIMPRNSVAAFASHGLMKVARTAPALRRLLEEQGIRPANRYRRGLFLKPSWGAHRKSGSMLPQEWLVDMEGNERRSDEVFGNNFALVGLGVDPEQHLDDHAIEILRKLRAIKIWVAAPNQTVTNSAGFTRKMNAPVPPKGEETIVLVRPDRIIVGACNARELTNMLKAVERQIFHSRPQGF